MGLLLMAITMSCFSLFSAASCSCSDLTITDSQTGQASGACLTGISGQAWCFVTQDSSCTDKKALPRSTGLHYSAQASQEGSLGEDQQALEPAEQEVASLCLIPFN